MLENRQRTLFYLRNSKHKTFRSAIINLLEIVVKQDLEYFMCSPFEFNSESSRNPLLLLFYYFLLHTSFLGTTFTLFITYNYYIPIISFESIES